MIIEVLFNLLFNLAGISPEAVCIRCIHFFPEACARLFICDRCVFGYAGFKFLGPDPK